jgi:hypothetical protein
MNKAKIVVRIGSNPNHHLWNNNGTWWLHYTEHLPDYTKRRVRFSLYTHHVRIARIMRDFLLSSDSTETSAPVLHQAA